MLKKVLRVTKELAALYSGKELPRASAALSYYMTMTVFPLIICLYSLLGSNYGRAMELLDLAESFLAINTVHFIQNFLDYVASDSSPAMLVAGLTVLVSSSSAAIRSIQATIGEMQGGGRFQGITDFLFSVVLSLAFLAAMYFSVLVMLTGQQFLAFVGRYLPFVDADSSWRWLRFIVLAGIEFAIFAGVYETSKRRSDKYNVLPGALLASAGTVVMSAAFSVFISESTKYTLVYGSLASVILLMLWLYFCCQVIYIGAALNVVLRNIKRRGQEYSSNMGKERKN